MKATEIAEIDATQLLQQHFGFREFRLGQQQVVETILAGESAAAIFPTGSGKSLCYQLPALQLPHITLVISPLLALMKDQIYFLKSKGIAAASIDSSQSSQDMAQVMELVRQGQIKIVMISVERLNNERFRRFIESIPISLLVVDEAHCISEWGHNFRPDYLKLPRYREELGIEQILLLTATATEAVVSDMAEKFHISLKNIVKTGFYRPNLNLQIHPLNNDEKLSYLLQWLTNQDKHSGIIYVTLQKTAEELASELNRYNINSCAYHAGLNSLVRNRIQDDFMYDRVQIIVATIAFGMGIDKSDIRFIVHYDLPKSIENYAQEIGRAGRDGQQANCLMIANESNLPQLENFIYGDMPEKKALALLLDKLASCEGELWEVSHYQLSSDTNIKQLPLKTVLVYLELDGVLSPAYSYFSEYKFKFLWSEKEILANFNGERRAFIEAIFTYSHKAKLWSTLAIDELLSSYPCERSRVITALNYLDEQQMITLQAKQMTHVYQLYRKQFDDNYLEHLVARFEQKQQSELNRLAMVIDFFRSEYCLSRQLAQYFSAITDMQCGSCSVCTGAIQPWPPLLADSLNSFNYIELTTLAKGKLNSYFSEIKSVTSDLITNHDYRSLALALSHFLCGISTPLSSQCRLRALPNFGILSQYKFAQVLSWVTNHEVKNVEKRENYQ